MKLRSIPARPSFLPACLIAAGLLLSACRSQPAPPPAPPVASAPAPPPPAPGLSTLINVDVDQASFVSAVDAVRQAAGLNIVIHWESPEIQNLDLNAAHVTLHLKSVPVRDVMLALLMTLDRPPGADWPPALVVDNGILHVADPATLKFAAVPVRYDLRDLLPDLNARPSAPPPPAGKPAPTRPAPTAAPLDPAAAAALCERFVGSRAAWPAHICAVAPCPAGVIVQAFPDYQLQVQHLLAAIQHPDPTRDVIGGPDTSLLIAMDQKIDLVLNNVTLAEALATLSRDIAGRLITDSDSLAKAGIDSTKRLSLNLTAVPWRVALQTLLDRGVSDMGDSPAAAPAGGIVLVSTPEALMPYRPVRVYPIPAEAAADPAKLRELLDIINISLHDWDDQLSDDAPDAGIFQLPGRLVIRARPDQHAQLLRLLTAYDSPRPGSPDMP